MRLFYSPGELSCHHEAISGPRLLIVPDPEWSAPLIDMPDPLWVRPVRSVRVLDGMTGEVVPMEVPDLAAEPPMVQIADPEAMPPMIEVINPSCRIPADAVEISVDEHLAIVAALNSMALTVVMVDGRPSIVEVADVDGST